MKTKNKLYETPQCVESSVDIVYRNICSTSSIDYQSSLEDWEKEDLDLG